MATGKPSDLQDLQNWLTSRGATEDCPACGASDWIPPPRQFALLAADDEGEFGPAMFNYPVFPVAAFACGNCAFIRLHSPRVLKLLQDASPPSDGD
jgi:hypothetical protein